MNKATKTPRPGGSRQRKIHRQEGTTTTQWTRGPVQPRAPCYIQSNKPGQQGTKKHHQRTKVKEDQAKTPENQQPTAPVEERSLLSNDGQEVHHIWDWANKPNKCRNPKEPSSSYWELVLKEKIEWLNQ